MIGPRMDAALRRRIFFSLDDADTRILTLCVSAAPEDLSPISNMAIQLLYHDPFTWDAGAWQPHRWSIPV